MPTRLTGATTIVETVAERAFEATSLLVACDDSRWSGLGNSTEQRHVHLVVVGLDSSKGAQQQQLANCSPASDEQQEFAAFESGFATSAAQHSPAGQLGTIDWVNIANSVATRIPIRIVR